MKFKSILVAITLAAMTAACAQNGSQFGTKQTVGGLGGAALGGWAGSTIGGGTGKLAATAAGRLSESFNI